MMNENIQQYAGFWRRLAAYFIDSIVIIFAMNIFQGYLSTSLGTSLRNTMDYETIVLAVSITTGFFSIPFSWAYFSGMESSPLQATIGKLAVGIYVTDLQGIRLTFGRATARYFAKVLSGAVLMLGYIMAGFTEKRQALHDNLAGSLVLVK
jgi:uncharacterized RDD family membrane protein YckC